MCIWNQFSVSYSRYKREHFRPIFWLKTKNHKFLEFSKSLSKTSKKQQFDYEHISAVRCKSERGQLTTLEKVASGHNYNFRGCWCFFFFFFFLPLQEQSAENANESYYVCKVIIVLHITPQPR